MIPLDNRLRYIYDAVGSCECIADIGSDHAKIPIALLQTGRAKTAIACDINKGPLEKSRENAKKYKVENIEFIQSDGFDLLKDKNFDKATICGMGGTLISDIIKRGGSKAHCDLILQPMTAYEELRAFLWDNGFTIFNETFTVDSGKPYVVISCRYNGSKEVYSYSDLFLGKIRPKTNEFAIYCKKISVQVSKKHKGALIKGDPTKDLEQLIRDCKIYRCE